MRAWAKRMIWFFGYSAMLLANHAVTYATKTTTNENASLMLALGWFLPLLLMKDDPEKGDENGKRKKTK